MQNDSYQSPNGQPSWPQQPQGSPDQPPYPPTYQPAYQPEQSASTPALPEETQPSSASATSLMPQPVVNVYSPRGVEYVFLAITLFAGAIGLASLLIAFINWSIGFNSLVFPIALLMVSLPVFSWLFLRLKKAELNNPSLALDASKRRTTQSIQIISFLTCFFTAIGFVTSILYAFSGEGSVGDLFKLLFSLLAIFVVAGGILFYYWRDEHRLQ